MNAEKNIFVEREVFEKDGKSYFSYFIRGNVRGKDVRVAIIPPDKGGYTVLDIVFGSAMAAELVVKPFEIKDDATGKVISGNTYAVKSYDEYGVEYIPTLILFNGGKELARVTAPGSKAAIDEFIEGGLYG